MKIITIISRNLQLTIILLIGLILRLVSSISHTFSSDELSALTRLKFNNFSDFFNLGIMEGDMHPAGVQVFLKIWSSLFGTSELIYRLPFILSGVISIYLIYLIGRNINQNTGLISASIMAALTFPVIQSELARPYSPGLLFILFSTLYILKLIKRENKIGIWKDTLILGLLIGATMYMHYFAFLSIAIISLTSFLFVKKEYWKYFIISGSIAIILFLPHLKITVYHLSIEGGLQWLAKPKASWIFEFFWHFLNESYIILSLILGIIIFGILKTKPFKFTRIQFLFLFWFIAVYLFAYLISQKGTPILKFPVMLFPIPFLVIFFSSIIENIKIKYISIYILFIISISSIFENKLFSNTQYEVFSELVDPMIEWEDKYGKQNILKIMNVSNPYYLNYYAEQKGHQFKFNLTGIEYSDYSKFENICSKSKKDYLILGYSGRNTPVNFFISALTEFPYIISSFKYNNSAVFLLSKKEEESIKQLNKKVLYSFPNEPKGWVFESNNYTPKLNYYLIDSITKYKPQISFSPNKNMIQNNEFIYFEIDAQIEDGSQLSIVISAENINGETILNIQKEPIWIGKELEGMLKQNRKAYFAFSVPKDLKTEDQLKIYLWHRNKKAIYLKSFKIFSVENIWN